MEDIDKVVAKWLHVYNFMSNHFTPNIDVSERKWQIYAAHADDLEEKLLYRIIKVKSMKEEENKKNKILVENADEAGLVEVT